jgi:kinesin family protein 3/17
MFLKVTINNPMKGDVGPKSFTFDAVFDMDTQQKAFYEEACYPLIESVMDGFNGTIFAYGQTGCGKTWTMQGLSHPPELRGAIPNSFDHIFQNIKSDPATQFLVRCSYLEVPESHTLPESTFEIVNI